MTQATLGGPGVLLEYETVQGASPLAFTTLPEVQDIPELPNTRTFVEATNQDSTGDTREYIPGLIDAEEFTVLCNYLPNNSDQTALRTMLTESTPRVWQIRDTRVSPEAIARFDAYVGSFNPSGAIGEIKSLSVTIRRTGPITWL